MSRVEIKRVYEPPAKSDGERILVDRVWPRGLSKVDVAVEIWMKEVAPSSALRKWFGHEPDRWPEFQKRYLEELEADPQAEWVDDLVARARRRKITLVFGAKDEERNQAVVLSGLIRKRLSS